MSNAPPDSATQPESVRALLGRIKAYAASRGVAVARVSDLVLKGGAEVDRIEAGGDIGARKIDRANAALDHLEAQVPATETFPASPGATPGEPPTRRRRSKPAATRSAP